MILKGAIERDLLEELRAAERDIKRGEERRRAAQNALDTIHATGEKYVGEREDQREKEEKEKQVAALKAVAGAMEVQH